MALGDGALRQKIVDVATEYDAKVHEFVDRINLSPEDRAAFDAVDSSFHKLLEVIEEGAGMKLFQRIRERIQAWRAARQGG